MNYCKTQTDASATINSYSDFTSEVYNLIPSVCEFLVGEEDIHSIRRGQVLFHSKFLEFMKGSRISFGSETCRILKDFQETFQFQSSLSLFFDS